MEDYYEKKEALKNNKIFMHVNLEVGKNIELKLTKKKYQSRSEQKLIRLSSRKIEKISEPKDFILKDKKIKTEEKQ